MNVQELLISIAIIFIAVFLGVTSGLLTYDFLKSFSNSHAKIVDAYIYCENPEHTGLSMGPVIDLPGGALLYRDISNREYKLTGDCIVKYDPNYEKIIQNKSNKSIRDVDVSPND